ncbi:MAG TPA: hypothetical protein VHO90_03360 [Bacteroidales bacterium]|nr:hypothetical protein [Bacteroidales bacterium]
MIWALALVITAIAAIYQRKTGPTYPKTYKVQIGSDLYKIPLLRAHGGERECLIEIPVDDKDVTGHIYFKRYKTNDQYQAVRLVQYRNELCAVLPHQPPAGKLQYYVELVKDDKHFSIAKEEPAIIRFRGDVPGYIIIPHVLLIFLAMFFSTLCGLYIIFKKENYRKYVSWTFYTMLIGGFVFGPLMQKFAFNEFWTGIPFGFDLTDNKTLFAFIFWVWAFVANRKKTRPIPVMIACVMTLVIFSIPHSLMGSELDYSTNKVNTGIILLNLY